MNADDKNVPFLIMILLLILACIYSQGCATVKSESSSMEYYENGQLKKEEKTTTVKNGVIFSEGKVFKIDR
jgi:uncharacterized protein YceK